jgi:ankyrin repeat protein
VYCQLETLRHCLPPSIRGILDELPETLDETYERVLRDINKANREHAHRLLQCLSVAIRPLRVDELAEVLAVDFDAVGRDGIPRLNPDWRWEDQQQAVLSTCSSLVAIVDDGSAQVVQFSHFSVKEYLTSKRLASSSGDISQYHILLGPAHKFVAQACLGVLFHLDDQVNKANAREIPLAEYAAQHWVKHAQFESVSSSIQDSIEHFFCADEPRSAWLRVCDVDELWVNFFYSVETDGGPLYYAALCGFYAVVEHLIVKHLRDVYAEGVHKETPLMGALRGGHSEVAELLLRYGANIDVRDEVEWTLLHRASILGLVDLAEWLLNHGADVNAKDRSLWTPLYRAIFYGDFKIAWILLEHKADISTRDIVGMVALHLASRISNIHMRLNFMRLLLEHGADVNAQDDAGSTALHILASQNHYPPSVEELCLLLKYGANTDVEDNEGKTALQIALEKGHEETVGLLIEHGAKKTQGSASTGAVYRCVSTFSWLFTGLIAPTYRQECTSQGSEERCEECDSKEGEKPIDDGEG